MNAGAYGGEMKDVLFKCEHIDKNGDFGTLSGDELALFTGIRRITITDAS